jgi:hypothetical protein
MLAAVFTAADPDPRTGWHVISFVEEHGMLRKAAAPGMA